MWLGVMVLNSTYSFYWDVEQDWDLPWLMQYGEQGVLCVGLTFAGCSQIRLHREYARVTSIQHALTRKCRQKSALSVLPLLLLLLLLAAANRWAQAIRLPAAAWPEGVPLVQPALVRLAVGVKPGAAV